MEYFREWAVSLVMLVSAGAFLENVAPSGNMKKYVSFIFALIILSAMLSPIELFK
ncbi:MAG: hypothetical protein HFE90_08475 [Firmicutes bacterium]|nr:hypothetical protein [Bacillota bacterium]